MSTFDLLEASRIKVDRLAFALKNLVAYFSFSPSLEEKVVVLYLLSKNIIKYSSALKKYKRRVRKALGGQVKIII